MIEEDKGIENKYNDILKMIIINLWKIKQFRR